MQQVDIAIVGAGIVGLTLASALKDSGLSVAIISNKPIQKTLHNAYELRVSAIHAANQKAFSDLGVWQSLPMQRISAYKKMHVWDKDSFGSISFDCEEVQATELGHIIENQALVNSLAENIAQHEGITLLPCANIEKVLTGQHESMLMVKDENDSEQTIACRLVVGADGAQSMIRKHASFPQTFKHYDHSAIVATIRTELPHKQVARQAFTPTGPLALLPLAEPHTCSIVYSQQTDVADNLMQQTNEAFCHSLQVASDNLLGDITLESQRMAFPLVMRYTRQWVTDGVVILGDAAHTIHPLAGQGANLGIQDALALAKTITALNEQSEAINLHSNLRAFERSRKTEAVKMIAAMEGFKQLFDGKNPIKKFARGLGLKAVDQFTPLKHRFISQAMGW